MLDWEPRSALKDEAIPEDEESQTERYVTWIREIFVQTFKFIFIQN